MTKFVQSDCLCLTGARSKGFGRVIYVTDLGKPGNRCWLLPEWY